jgi:hypothetical protein
MWLFTPFGFFSVVQKPGDKFLTVRTRAKGDLERLREKYLPELSETITGAGTDYPFRATASHEAIGRALAAVAKDITYSNFKNEVARRMGHERAHVYGDVWRDLLQLEKDQGA